MKLLFIVPFNSPVTTFIFGPIVIFSTLFLQPLVSAPPSVLEAKFHTHIKQILWIFIVMFIGSKEEDKRFWKEW
jgi:hypothetical protein